MDIPLTKDAEKLVAAAYKRYLEKRKSGVSKALAKRISVEEIQPVYFSDLTREDYLETVAEMCRALGCTMFFGGAFLLNDLSIVYMENRFQNGLKDTLGFLAQFIP